MHGKKSFKGENKSERNGKNTAKLLKYYTPSWMLHVLLVYHYTSEAHRYGETMYTGVLFHEEFRHMLVSFTCACVLHCLLNFLFCKSTEPKGEENTDVAREEYM